MTKFSLKTAKVLLDADGHVLTYALIFIKVHSLRTHHVDSTWNPRGVFVGLAPNCFKNHTNSYDLIPFLKKFCLVSGVS